jgi:hypothetical protein
MPPKQSYYQADDDEGPQHYEMQNHVPQKVGTIAEDENDATWQLLLPPQRRKERHHHHHPLHLHRLWPKYPKMPIESSDESFDR